MNQQVFVFEGGVCVAESIDREVQEKWQLPETQDRHDHSHYYW